MLATRSHIVSIDPSLAPELIQAFRIDACISVSMLTLIVYNACWFTILLSMTLPIDVKS